MGKNSRLRREARRRAQSRPAATPPRATSRPGAAVTHDQDEIIALIQVAVRYATGAPRAASSRIAELNTIGAVAPSPHFDPAALVVDEVLSRIRQAWEYGWQPLDLVHAARRRTSSNTATWLVRAVLVEAGRTAALDRAPQDWADQLRTLTTRGHVADQPADLLTPGGRASVPDWIVALVALDFMHELPRSQMLIPPPSQWGRERPRSSSSASPQLTEQRAKTLTKIRALLAKAESTDFVAEAEALTAKAQDLMTRHAIDEALLADETGQAVDVGSLRVLIHHPYAVEKTGLLNVIGSANRCRAVWNDFASYATLIGVPTDLAQVEMLFTSTLVQATRAMTQAGDSPGSGDRSSSFRKAFLSAYAHRIGQRLADSSHETTATYGTDLVPVLKRQGEAIDGEFDRLFPHVTSGSRRSSYDARGWDAGTRAADAAVLPAGAVES